MMAVVSNDCIQISETMAEVGLTKMGDNSSNVYFQA